MTDDLNADIHPHAHVVIEEDGEWFTMPLDGARHGHLRFPAGISPNVSIRGDRKLDAFFTMHFVKPVPDIHVTEETISIRYRSFRRGGWSARPGSIVLNTTIPWTIDVIGGMASMDLDLRDVRVEAIDVNGGISRVVVTLPRPTGVLPFRITGGVSELVIRRPEGTGARVIVNGGAAGLTLDDNYFSAVGGGMRWDAPDGHDVEDRIELSINGGASRVRLERYVPSEPAADNTTRIGS